MKWAGFFYGGFAYWMITNHQLFENCPVIKDYQMQVIYYDHFLFELPPYLF